MTNDDSIKLINADNDEMALGAIASLGSKVGITTSKIIVTGFDGTADAIASVNTDKMFGTVKQNPLKLGKKSIQAAIEALGDKDFEDIQKNEKLLVETTVITKENVGDFLT
jgi:ribose transport system substrate-binding protein